MAFIRKVYTILTCQLLLTAALSSASFFSASYKTWIQSHSWMMWISLFGAIGFMLLTFWKRKSYPTNLLFLGGFTAMEAYSVSVITSFYNSKIVLMALVFTLTLVVVTLVGSIWVMYHMDQNMMPMSPHEALQRP